MEVKEKAGIVCDYLLNAYNNANGTVEALEASLDALQETVESDLPEDEGGLVRIPVGHTYFDGSLSFSPELEDYANLGLPYDAYFGELRGHISEYRTKIDSLLVNVKDLTDSAPDFYSSIETDVQDVMLYLDMLESLEGNYLNLYNSAVWELDNDPQGWTQASTMRRSFISTRIITRPHRNTGKTPAPRRLAKNICRRKRMLRTRW